MKAVALAATILSCAGAAACSLAMASDLDDARESVLSPSPDQSDSGGVSPGDIDGGGEPDAETDAGGDAAVRKRGCRELDPPPRFCVDFDDGELADKWDGMEVTGGTIAFDSLAYSASRSARIRLVDAPNGSNAFLHRIFSGVGTSSFDIRVQVRPSSPWNTEYSPLGIGFGSGCIVFLNAVSDGSGAIGSTFAFIPGAGVSIRPLAGGLRVDEWTDVRIKAMRQGSGVTISFAFERPDGTVNETTESVAECALGGDLAIGMGYHSGSGTSETRYDDVRVYWE